MTNPSTTPQGNIKGGWILSVTLSPLSVAATTTAANIITTSFGIQLHVSAGNIHQGEISAFGADGFTVTWSTTGSPTGTMTVGYLAIG